MSDHRDHREQREALGAYVVGALAPAERHELEAHLEACGSCRDEVARLSVLPPLLAHLQAEEVEADLPMRLPDTLPAVVAAAGRERRRSTRQVGAWRAVAAAAVVVALAVTWAPWRGSDAPTDVLSAVARPVAADAEGTEGTVDAYAWEWGTTVALDVTHLPARDAYVLWVVSEDGRRQQAGSFGPTAARAATVRGAAAIARHDIVRIEITDAHGQVLLAFDLAGGPTIEG